MKKVLFILGSLRKDSFNKAYAEIAMQKLAGKAEVTTMDYSALPLFNQDLESPVLPAVQKMRDDFAAADIIWIVSPVYNQNIPGTLKNVLDWASRKLDPADRASKSIIAGKKVTLTVNSFTGQDKVIENLSTLLNYIGMEAVGEFTGNTINKEVFAGGAFALNEEGLSKLEAQVQAVLEA